MSVRHVRCANVPDSQFTDEERNLPPCDCESTDSCIIKLADCRIARSSNATSAAVEIIDNPIPEWS
ncbi:MAG: hypothetical protein F4205_18125 [Gemmatimonadetes bacterium]|nr:hypothetical protein [Gemmatimonadota bacterium]MYG37392.1 hypothetical protein [Gemmatimonadota bacterium]